MKTGTGTVLVAYLLIQVVNKRPEESLYIFFYSDKKKLILMFLDNTKK